MFCNPRTGVFLYTEKFFGKISYISYTHTPEFQYLLVISCVG